MDQHTARRRRRWGELTRLKPQPGKDILILGSSALTTSLIEVGVLDEVRMMVSPVILGSGKSVFRTARRRISLRFLSSRAFRSGNMLLTYRTVTPSRRETALGNVS